jgi:benzylsuccinate CoA-transferase BbsE subunit
MDKKGEDMLSPYRVLDLADEKGLMCGKILGDLGADVIKIEKPGGDEARRIGPFYHDEPHPEKSLFWFALNTSKRGITLNLETKDGQNIFKKLVRSSDFVVETFAPGYLDKIGLGYKALTKIKPDIIMVSITPFGQTGPYRDWKISDIVAWAMGGEMSPFGDPDRPPIRISHHAQSYFHAGNDGAQGALMALYHRWKTGEGQRVDVSVFESVAQCTEHLTSAWDLRGTFPKRKEESMTNQGHKTRRLYPCKDGWVSWSHGGPSRLAPSLPLIKWMEADGFTNDFLKNFNWNRPDFPRISQEDMDKIEEPTTCFFMSKTKAELLEGAVKYQIMMYPVFSNKDMLTNPQLAARRFWEQVEHPELNETITYPGAFGLFSESKVKISRRAPLIGEHNEEIYVKEMGFSKEKLILLKQANVI